MTYALDTAIWGRRPFGYHLTNVLLHALNVVLVFWVAFLAVEDRKRQRGQLLSTDAPSTVVAFTTAALFAVHPMLTQAVGYVSGRSEVAYAAFFLLAFLAGRRWMLHGGKRWWLACVGLWGVAMLTKESAAMLSFVLLGYDWLMLDAAWAERRRRFSRLGLPLLAMTFLAGAGRLIVLGMVEYPDRTGADGRFALVAVDVFWRYLGMLALPRDQSIFHAVPLLDDPFAPRALAGLIGLAAFVAVAWWLRRVHSLTSLGLFWFLLLLVPSSALFILGIGEPMAEHRVYVASVGVFLAWGCAFGMLLKRTTVNTFPRRLAYVAGTLFLLQLGVQTIVRNAVWDDAVGLSREAARLAPNHWMPRLLLGEAFRQTGRCEDAVLEYRAAIALRPEEQFPYTKLAGCLIEAQRLAEAESALRQLRDVDPSSLEAAMGLGVLAAAGHRPEEARRHFLETLERNPQHGQARQLLAFLDGTLPDAEHQRLCDEMRMLGQDAFDVNACRSRLTGNADAAAVSGP